jgi:hypothetical protein
MKITVFWDVTLYGLLGIYQRSQATYYLPSSSGEGVSFYSEDGSRNSDAEVNLVTI